MLVFVPHMAVRLPHLVCIVCWVVLSWTEGRSYAQLEYRLSAGSSIGISDISGSQSGATPGTQPDGFLMARAGAELDYAGRLTQDRAAYSFVLPGGSGYAGLLAHPHAESIERDPEQCHHASHAGGKRHVESAITGRYGCNSDPQTFGAIPAGTQEFAAVDATEAFTWQVNSAWRLDQMLDGRLYRPIGDNPGTAQNESLVLALGIARTWLRDQAGLRTRVGVIETGEAALAGAPVIRGYKSEFAEALLSWRRDWTPTWTSQLGLALSCSTSLAATRDRRRQVRQPCPTGTPARRSSSAWRVPWTPTSTWALPGTRLGQSARGLADRPVAGVSPGRNGRPRT